MSQIRLMNVNRVKFHVIIQISVLQIQNGVITSLTVWTQGMLLLSITLINFEWSVTLVLLFLFELER